MVSVPINFDSNPIELDNYLPDVPSINEIGSTIQEQFDKIKIDWGN